MPSNRFKAPCSSWFSFGFFLLFPGKARESQNEPGRARKSQEEPGGARKSQEEPLESFLGPQEEPGRSRRSFLGHTLPPNCGCGFHIQRYLRRSRHLYYLKELASFEISQRPSKNLLKAPTQIMTQSLPSFHFKFFEGPLLFTNCCITLWVLFETIFNSVLKMACYLNEHILIETLQIYVVFYRCWRIKSIRFCKASLRYVMHYEASLDEIPK